MSITDGIVAAAVDLIDYDSYVLQPDGSMLPQSNAQTSILGILRLLELEPGMRVLEVGAGSGYTGALLASMVSLRAPAVSSEGRPHRTTAERRPGSRR